MSAMLALRGLLFTLLPWLFPATAAPEELYVRVVDVGAGECCVIALPNGEHIVYDAGRGRSGFNAIRNIIPEGEEIALLVLSHSDADHLGAVPDICDKYEVRRVIRGGGPRDTDTWKAANEAILAEREEGCDDINLATRPLFPGSTWKFGEVFVTMVCGEHYPPSNWDIRGEPERQNAGSIVIRIEYRGRSVLFCGDTVGRHIDDDADALIAAEKFMVEMSPAVKIKSDAIIAPHHGADNGSSTAFINAVAPTFVIFSAGHMHSHPRAATAKRYLNAGIDVQNMFRTDLGDDEGVKEWDMGRVVGQSDRAGDDDVEIRIKSDGSMSVRYRAQ